MALPTETMKEKKTPTFGEKQVGTLAKALDNSQMVTILHDINADIKRQTQLFKDFFEQLREFNAALMNALRLKDDPKDVQDISEERKSDDIQSTESGGMFPGLAGILGAFALWSLDLDKVIIAGRMAVTAIRSFIDTILDLPRLIKSFFSEGKLAKYFANIFAKVSDFFKPVTDFFGKIGDFFKGLFKPIIAVFDFVKGILSPIFGIFRSSFSFVKPLLSFFKFLGGPVTLAVFALLDGIFGFIDGFKEGGILGGIEGAFTGIIKGFITVPLDLLKDLVSWAARMMGFENVSKFLDSFSFSELFDKLWAKIKEIFVGIGNWFGTLFTDPVLALEKAAGEYLNILKNIGGFIYNKAIKPVVDWIGTLFGAKEGETGAAMDTMIGEGLDWIKNFGQKIYDKVVKPVVDWFQTTIDSISSFEMPSIGNFNNKIKDLIRAVLPPADFFKYELPSYTIPVLGRTIGGGSIDLNPIPKALYDFAGVESPSGSIAPTGSSGNTGENIAQQSADVADGQRGGGNTTVVGGSTTNTGGNNNSRTSITNNTYNTITPQMLGALPGNF